MKRRGFVGLARCAALALGSAAASAQGQVAYPLDDAATPKPGAAYLEP
jgi:hypothetical protein